MIKTISLIRFFFLICCLTTSVQAFAANKLNSVRVWAAPDSTRVVLDLGQSPKYSHFFLTKPDRLVVDLQHTQLKYNLSHLKNNSKLIKKIRQSKPVKKGSLRIVIDLAKPVSAKLFSLSPTAPYGDRLVVDIEPKSKTGSANSSKQTSTSKPTVKPKQGLRDIVVAIDAGHGGDDPGSIGPTGTYEKRVVLEIAKRVAKKINNTPGMRAVMTRKGIILLI